MLGCNYVIQLYLFKSVLKANTVAYTLYYIQYYTIYVVWFRSSLDYTFLFFKANTILSFNLYTGGQNVECLYDHVFLVEITKMR